ncbi:MAG: substrate-binding domain-containing protein [Nitrososphaerota archaeon]
MNAKKHEYDLLRKKFSRRNAISTAGKVAISAIVAGVVAGVGGYYAGSAVAAPTTITKTETVTAAATTLEKTVTTTVSVPGAITTVTAPGTTITVTQPLKRPGEGMHFVFIGHWTAGPFAAIVQKGFSDAIEELGATGEFYMAEGDIKRQTDMIRMAVAKKVDGIVTTIVDAEAFDEPIAEALKAGIPVIAANADDPEGARGNPRLAFIGQTFYTAGYSLGDYVARKAEERKINLADQRIAIFTSFITSPWHKERGRGIRDALVDHGADPKKIEDVDCISEELATVERVQTSYLLANRDVKLFFGTDAIVSDRFASSAKAAGISPGEVMMGAFDVTPGVLEGIKEDYIVATITQQPYLQGWYAVYQLYIIRKYGFSGCDIDTGKGLVTKENVGRYEELVPKHIMG